MFFICLSPHLTLTFVPQKLDLRLAEVAEKAEKWKIILSPTEIRAVENDFRCSKVMKFGGYEFYDFDYDYFAEL